MPIKLPTYLFTYNLLTYILPMSYLPTTIYLLFSKVTYLFTYLPIYLPSYLLIYLLTYLFNIYLPVYLSTYLISNYLFIYLLICLCIPTYYLLTYLPT